MECPSKQDRLISRATVMLPESVIKLSLIVTRKREGGEWGCDFEVALHKPPIFFCTRMAYVDSCKFAMTKLLPYGHLSSI